MDEDLELQLIRQLEKREREREERIEKLLDESIGSFEDFYHEAFYNKLKRINHGSQTLEDYFNEDSTWQVVPIDLVLTDTIKNSKATIKNIVNTKFENAYTELIEKSDKVSIEKHYVHAIAVSYNALIQIVTTNPTYISRRRGFNPEAGTKTIKISNAFCLDLSKFKIVNNVNLKNSTQYVRNEISGIIPTRKKCSYLQNQLLKNITSQTKSQIVSRGGYFLSNIIINSLDIKHVLCPVYKIRFHKPGFDSEFIINAHTKQCKKI